MMNLPLSLLFMGVLGPIVEEVAAEADGFKVGKVNCDDEEELAMKSGVGLCFVRNLEQGKPTLRMDKVNQLLDLFNYELTATKKQ